MPRIHPDVPLRFALALAAFTGATLSAQVQPGASQGADPTTATDPASEWLAIDVNAIDPAVLAQFRQAVAALPARSEVVEMRAGVQAGEIIRVAGAGGAFQEVIPLVELPGPSAIEPGGSSPSCSELQALIDRQADYIRGLEQELAACQGRCGGGQRARISRHSRRPSRNNKRGSNLRSRRPARAISGPRSRFTSSARRLSSTESSRSG